MNLRILKSMFPKFLNHLHQIIMVVIVMNWIHDEANHMLSILEKPPEERFDAQHRIDRGDVSQLTWPIKLLHPSKSQVKASDTFYDELVCFFKDMYGMDVYVKLVQ